MSELLRSNDPVLISFLTAFLKSHGIEVFVLDYHTSMLEGSVGAIPRRVMVDADREAQARRLLTEAGIDHDPKRK